MHGLNYAMFAQKRPQRRAGCRFNTDAEELAHPATLFKHLTEMENGRYAGHIHRSGDDGCSGVQDIIDKHQIKPGALVCLTMDPEMADNVTLEGSHNHLMLYAGKDKSGEHCFYGFNNDIKDGKLKNHNIGYVCDSCGLFSDLIRDHHRVYLRGGYAETSQGGAVSMQRTSLTQSCAGKMPLRDQGSR